MQEWYHKAGVIFEFYDDDNGMSPALIPVKISAKIIPITSSCMTLAGRHLPPIGCPALMWKLIRFCDHKNLFVHQISQIKQI